MSNTLRKKICEKKNFQFAVWSTCFTFSKLLRKRSESKTESTRHRKIWRSQMFSLTFWKIYSPDFHKLEYTCCHIFSLYFAFFNLLYNEIHHEICESVFFWSLKNTFDRHAHASFYFLSP